VIEAEIDFETTVFACTLEGGEVWPVSAGDPAEWQVKTNAGGVPIGSITGAGTSKIDVIFAAPVASGLKMRVNYLGQDGGRRFVGVVA
jgi:hypothetical protein